VKLLGSSNNITGYYEIKEINHIALTGLVDATSQTTVAV
jgi:hypothetical protein